MIKTLRRDMIRWLMVALLAGLTILGSAYINRDVYSKVEVDDKIEASEEVRDLQYDELKGHIIYIRGRVDDIASRSTDG